MSFRWLDFISVAKELLNYENESYFRTAINRFYYGTFGTIRNLLEEKIKVSFSMPNIHKKVINFLKTHPEALYREAGVKLDLLRRERIRADYDSTERIDKSAALQSYNWVQELEPYIFFLKL